MTAGLSTFLDNVTTVLLISPIIFQIVKTLKITPYPFLYLEIFASNIGGTIAMCGASILMFVFCSRPLRTKRNKYLTVLIGRPFFSFADFLLFGGNGTLIGASANIIIVDLADKEGYKIRFF